MKKSVEILLVEDNPGDVLLTQTAFKRSRISNNLVAVDTAEKALSVLRRETGHESAPRPDLILLDLNLPGMTGTELLAIIKTDAALKTIPVVMLTSSDAEADIRASYEHYANSFVTKPISMRAFADVIQSLEGFWFEVVQLP